MNKLRDVLAIAMLAGLPVLAHGYAFGTAAPDGRNVLQNQVTGNPVVWYNAQQTFVFNFDGDYYDSAMSAMNEWNAVGTPMHWDSSSISAQPCNGADHINSAGWRTTTCDNTDFGDAIAVTKRSYEMIGDSWYLTDADIVANSNELWNPAYSGAIRTNSSGRRLQDFRRMILHELGHALGLDHPDDAGQTVRAIMNSQTSDIDSLQLDDKHGITALYAKIAGSVSNAASQISSSSGGGGGGWFIPSLAFAALLRRKLQAD